jgi:hypothetical protein
MLKYILKVINGISFSEFNSSVNYTIALKVSIAKCMADVTISNIMDLQVSQLGRRLIASSAQGSSIQCTYSVVTINSYYSADSLESQLSNSIYFGSFNTYLSQSSAQYNAPALASAESNFIAIISPTASPTMAPSSVKSKDDNQSGLDMIYIYAIAGGAGGLFVLMVAIYFYWYRHKKNPLQNSKESVSSHSSPELPAVKNSNNFSATQDFAYNNLFVPKLQKETSKNDSLSVSKNDMSRYPTPAKEEFLGQSKKKPDDVENNMPTTKSLSDNKSSIKSNRTVERDKTRGSSGTPSEHFAYKEKASFDNLL